MARKNRSNNSFAPIVITVLVAGVVGYYVIQDPPRSSLAEDGIQPETMPVPPPSGRGSDSSSEPTFQVQRSEDGLSEQAADPAGSSLGSKLNPPEVPSRPLLEGSSTASDPLAPGAASPGLDPTPSGSKLVDASTDSTGAPGTESKTPATPEPSGDTSDPKPTTTPTPEPKPTVAPTPKPKPVASTEVYTVQDGDVIITIAEDWFGESGRHDEIIDLNPGVDPTKLQIGQILKMPRKNQPRTKPVDPTLAANEYRIAPNDNYTRIARLLLGDEARASEIAALNPDLDPGNLQVGTIIKLPPKRVRKPEARPVKRPPLRTGEQYYTVKSGDSLARIVGDLWGVQREDWVELLYQRNKDTIGEDRTKLNLKQILIIPVKPKS